MQDLCTRFRSSIQLLFACEIHNQNLFVERVLRVVEKNLLCRPAWQMTTISQMELHKVASRGGGTAQLGGSSTCRRKTVKQMQEIGEKRKSSHDKAGQ